MTIDIAYLFYTTALVLTFTLIIVFIEFIKFKRWAKWMDEQPEATPYREPEPVQLSKLNRDYSIKFTETQSASVTRDLK